MCVALSHRVRAQRLQEMNAGSVLFAPSRAPAPLRLFAYPMAGFVGPSSFILIKPITFAPDARVARLEGGWASRPPLPGLHFNPGSCA